MFVLYCLISLIGFYFLLKFLAFVSLKNNFLIDSDTIKEQSFHLTPTPIVGGLFILLFILINGFIFLNNNFIISPILLFLFFVIGFIDDLSLFKSPFIRLSLIIIGALLSVIFFDTRISFVDIEFFDYFLANPYFSIFFSCACILFIVNGFNFIDGFNGLLSIHFLLILLLLLIVVEVDSNYKERPQLSYAIFLCLACNVIFLLFNFPYGKIFLGDSGSYLLGIIVSVLTITSYKIMDNVSPIFFAILLYYSFFEVFFSFLRKIISKKSPFYPDKEHLHMKIYRIINLHINNKSKSNYLTSIACNVFFLISILPSYVFRSNTVNCLIYFIALLLIYCIFYYLINSYEKKLLSTKSR